MRIRGLEALRKWMSEDSGVSGIVEGSEIIGKSVSLLRRKTKEDKEKSEEGEEVEEEGICVSEKNGILGIVLEVVEGGGWKGSYEELEEVVGHLEEEGEKMWRERKRMGKGEGSKWREMGRLAREIGWGIERRKRREEGDGGDGSMITLYGMKKNLTAERKRTDEEKQGREEEKKRADEEKRKREEAERRETEEKRMKEEEKKKRKGREKQRNKRRERWKSESENWNKSCIS